MSETVMHAAEMMNLLPEADQEFAYQFIKKLLIAWDPDFTKLTSQEEESLLAAEKSGFIEKIKDAVRVISVMLSHSLEDSIETADSMKARGYGLKGRTAYSNYSFTKRDAIALLLICISTASLIVLRVFGTAKYRYFPSVKGELTGIDSVIFFTLYFLLMIMPFVINIWEGIRWKRLQSAI